MEEREHTARHLHAPDLLHVLAERARHDGEKLALDVALANGDGYWNDGSDFNVYLSDKGRFLVTPHDANEGFRGRSGNAAQSSWCVLVEFFRSTLSDSSISGHTQYTWRP